MRRLLALGLLTLACLIVVPAWLLVALAVGLKAWADRLRGRMPTTTTPIPPPPIVEDPVAWAAIVAHERDMRAGKARVQ